MPKVLGVYTGHDPAACLLVDGALVVAIEEERLTRVKHGLPKDVRALWPRFGGRFGYFPWASVSYCLDAAGLGIDDLDAIVLPEEAEATAMAEILPLKDRRKVIISNAPDGGAHHYRHALSAFLASPFERAAVLVVDGDGSVDGNGYEAESGYLFEDRRGASREVFKNRYPFTPLRHGLGWAYEYVSALLGFVAEVGYLGEPGKTMGLAPFGRPSPELETPWIVPDGFRFDFRPFHEWLVRHGHAKRLRFDDKSQALIRAEEAIPQHARDLAYKVQIELEAALLHLARELHRATGAERLCLAGGVFLNSVANARIAAEGPYKEVWVQPASHDGGQALGLAYDGHLRLTRGKPSAPALAPQRHAATGRSYSERTIGALLGRSGLAIHPLADDAALARDAAGELANKRYVGWFQGGSEIGPRALGHRSILADPRGPEVKDRLNARVKFREGFRPFAPSALAERAGEVFDLHPAQTHGARYMLMVVPVRESLRAQVPAITHVDGTARVQLVDREADPVYHALIAAFAERTGLPLVLNTSFNLRGMPIVETPQDALRCFLYTELDVLYLGRHKVTRPKADRLVPEAAPGWELIVEEHYGWGGSGREVRYARDEERVDVPPLGELVALCRALDGKRTLQAAATEALGGPPDAATLEALLALVRTLCRKGALRLRVGSLVL